MLYYIYIIDEIIFIYRRFSHYIYSSTDLIISFAPYYAAV